MKAKGFILCILMCHSAVRAGWASLFHKKITPQEMIAAQRINRYMFEKERVPHFSQLLFSWNAIRPHKGQFSFYVQVRNAHTKRWGTWHHMLEWGKNIQQSYATKSDGCTKYVHVRLETEKKQLADAFRIKVTGKNGALISFLKGVAVTTVNMNAFRPETIDARIFQLKSVHIPRVPKLSQFALRHTETNRICGPTSCTMLARYLTGQRVDPLLFAARSYDKGLDAYGSWPFNMAYAYEMCRGKSWFFNTRLDSFVELHQQLMRGIPVVVSVRGALRGAPRAYPNGHLLLVVGWDQKTKRVICHDPAMPKHHETERWYQLADFMKGWEQSKRLVYWVSQVT